MPALREMETLPERGEVGHRELRVDDQRVGLHHVFAAVRRDQLVNRLALVIDEVGGALDDVFGVGLRAALQDREERNVHVREMPCLDAAEGRHRAGIRQRCAVHHEIARTVQQHGAGVPLPCDLLRIERLPRGLGAIVQAERVVNMPTNRNGPPVTTTISP